MQARQPAPILALSARAGPEAPQATYGRDELLPLSETEFITDGELKFFTFIQEKDGVVDQVRYKSSRGELIATRPQQRRGAEDVRLFP